MKESSNEHDELLEQARDLQLLLDYANQRLATAEAVIAEHERRKAKTGRAEVAQAMDERNQLDPYAEAKQWLAEGRLQYKMTHINGIRYWQDAGSADFTAPLDRYRRRPDPVLVPLGPDDVPPGSTLETDMGGWMMITSVGLAGVVCTAYSVGCIKWDDLKRRFKINRNDGKGFVPARKEAV